MGPFSFTVPAQLATLALPVGPLKRRLFKQYLARVQSAAEVRLVDVTPDTSGGATALFNPQAFPSGKVVYRLDTAPPHDSLFPLFDVEPWRELLVVLGIAHYKDVTAADLETALQTLRETYGVGVSVNILVFGVPEAEDFPASKHIMPVLSSNYQRLETAMCDVTANVFANMGALAIAKRLDSFKSPSLKILDRPALLPTDARGSARLVGPSASARASHESSPAPLSNGGSPAPAGFEKVTRRARHQATASGVTVTRTGSISMGLTERAKSRQRGRALKYMGSLYLQAGLLPEALHELVEAAQVLKQANDHLWFASALESIGVCLLLQWFYEMPVPIPNVALAAVSGESEKHASKALKGDQNMAEFLPQLMDTVIRHYGRVNPETEDVLPQTMYHETVLRFCNLLATLRLGGGWNGATLSAVVRDTTLKPNITPQSPSIQGIERWCSLLLNPTLEEISPQHTTRLLNGLGAVYLRLGEKRKWAFVVQYLIKILSNADREHIDEVPARLFDSLLDQFMEIYRGGKLQLACIQSLTALATRLGHVKFVAKASALLLAVGVDHLDSKEQRRAHRVLREGAEIDQEYWDPHILRDIKLPQASNVLNATTQVQKQTSTGNIIYNPFAKEDAESFQMIQNDDAHVHAYLQNPFLFEIHIYEIHVVDKDGNKIGESLNDVFLPTRNVHRLSISVKPEQSGTLEIGGCFIQVSGCLGRVYWLETRTQPSQKFRAKQIGTVVAVRREIKVRVLPARPTLVLRKTSLQKGWSMLLEGERTSFTLEIANVSSTPSEMLQFGFNDSTIEPLKQAIAKPDVTRAEVYELELFLHERRAIEMLSASRPLKAHSSEVYEFELNGKRGVTSATILVSYGTVGEVEHRLRVPLSITVYSSVELDRVDIMKLDEGSSINGDLLVVLDLRNSWRQALDVEIWSLNDENQPHETVTHRIDSLKTQRFLVPITWAHISQELLQRPIPSLSGRQYVVDHKTSAEAIRQFWLRELLLKKLGGRWKTVPDENVEPRKGTVEFRGIQLTKRMVNLLKTNPLELTLSVAEPRALVVEEMFKITATITNNSAQTKHGMLRFIPSNVNKLLYMGNLQRPVSVGPGEEVQVSLQALSLVHGQMSCAAIFDVIGGGQAFQKWVLRFDVSAAPHVVPSPRIA